MSVEQVRVQFLLCSAWSNDENRAFRRNRARNRFQKRMIDESVAAVARIRLMVEVGMRMGAVNLRRLAGIAIEAEDLGHAMIEPNERVDVIVHDVILARRIHEGDTGHCVRGGAFSLTSRQAREPLSFRARSQLVAHRNAVNVTPAPNNVPKMTLLCLASQSGK